jgi:hypothetical protein
MADEPENLVLIQLREIRSDLQDVKAKQTEHDRRFDRIDKRFSDMDLLIDHALGLGMANKVKAREIDARQEESEARQRRMDERMVEIERRLGKVEEKTDG